MYYLLNLAPLYCTILTSAAKNYTYICEKLNDNLIRRTKHNCSVDDLLSFPHRLILLLKKIINLVNNFLLQCLQRKKKHFSIKLSFKHLKS